MELDAVISAIFGFVVGLPFVVKYFNAAKKYLKIAKKSILCYNADFVRF